MYELSTIMVVSLYRSGQVLPRSGLLPQQATTNICYRFEHAVGCTVVILYCDSYLITPSR